MKIINLIPFLGLIVCSLPSISQSSDTTTTTTTTIITTTTTTTTDITSSPVVLVGTHKVEHLETSNDHSWFNKNYSEYSYDSSSIAKLKSLPAEYHLVVVAGTWCADTHLQLPRFYKVIDDAAIPRERIKLYFVDRELKDPELVSKKFKIKKVPTFILMKGDREQTRIVEKPKLSIEKDLVKAVK